MILECVFFTGPAQKSMELVPPNRDKFRRNITFLSGLCLFFTIGWDQFHTFLGGTSKKNTLYNKDFKEQLKHFNLEKVGAPLEANRVAIGESIFSSNILST